MTAFVIEVDGEPAGVVLAEAAGVRFFASDRAYWDLEGEVFRSARHAERAAARLQARRIAAGRANGPAAAAVAPHTRGGIWAEMVGRYLGGGGGPETPARQRAAA